MERERQEVIQRVKRNGNLLELEDECWRRDEPVVLVCVHRNHEAFRFASEELRHDESFVWRAVKTNYKVLRFVSDDLRRSRTFMLRCVVEHRVHSLSFACEATLRSDREFMLSCIRVHGSALQFASDQLKDDRELVLVAIENNGYLKYASPELRSDRAFVRQCVRIKPRSIEFVSDELKNDTQFILSLLTENDKCWKHITDHHTKDEQFMLEAIRRSCNSATIRQYMHHSLRRNFHFLWQLVKLHAEYYSLYASRRFKQRHSLFILKCIELHGSDFMRRVSIKARSDPRFVLRAVKKDPECIRFASKKLQRDDEFKREISENIDSTTNVCPSEIDDARFEFELEQVFEDVEGKIHLEDWDEMWRNDEYFMLQMVKWHSFESLAWIGEQLDDNRQFITLCMRVSNGWALKYASPKWRDDNEVVFTAVSMRADGSSLEYASERLRQDKEFVMRCAKRKHLSLKYASPLLSHDREYVSQSIMPVNGRALVSVPHFQNDEIVVTSAVMHDGHALCHASDELRNNERVVMSAVKDNPKAILYASESLRNDDDFILKCINEVGPRVLAVKDIDESVVPSEWMDNFEFMVRAVKLNRQCLQYASRRLKSDEHFIQVVDEFEESPIAALTGGE